MALPTTDGSGNLSPFRCRQVMEEALSELMGERTIVG